MKRKVGIKRRAAILFGLICFSFTALYLWIGVLSGRTALQTAAQVQSERTLTVEAGRGTIYDASLRQLTDRQAGYLAVVIPTEESIGLLRSHCALSEDELYQKLQIGEVFVCTVDTPTLACNEILVFTLPTRYEGVAPHVLGYLNGERQGVAGIEQSYNRLLNRTPYTVTYRVDATGRAVAFTGVQGLEEKGDGVVLTLDRDLQLLCQEAGKSIEQGAIVMMECATGKLRAVASFPEYPQDRPDTVLESEDGALLNRAFTPYAVGSAFKVVTMADALAEGVKLPTEFVCNGSIAVHGVEFACHNKSGHGRLNGQQAMAVSCNPYFIALGQMLSPDRLLQTARDCGFGKQTTLAEGLFSQSGVLPTQEELELPAGKANFSFGQGHFTATPVQLAQMISTVASGGICPTPSLVEGVTDGTQLPQSAPAASSRALSAQVAAQLRTALVGCLSEENANGAPRYTTAGGKTSTAQTGSYENGIERCNGWFVGYFPAEQPQYAVAIVVENASTGNQDAAPVFQSIADGWATAQIG